MFAHSVTATSAVFFGSWLRNNLNAKFSGASAPKLPVPILSYYYETHARHKCKTAINMKRAFGASQAVPLMSPKPKTQISNHHRFFATVPPPVFVCIVYTCV